MEALLAAGDGAAALKHARVYEVLVQQELDAPPDREVLALAQRIREQGGLVVRDALPPEPVPAAGARLPPSPEWPLAGPLSTTGSEKAGADSRRAIRRAGVAGLLALTLAGGVAVLRRDTPRELQIGRTSRITAEPGLEVHPALSPDGRFVAFASGPSGRLRIYVRHRAGGRTIAVTNGSLGDERWPRWSPDGTRLSFEAGRAIFVVPPLGGPAKLLVAPPRPGALVNAEGSLGDAGPSYLAWSPDGRRIAYALGRGIEVRALEGGVPTLIPTVAQPHSLAWSPDGSRLAFVLGNAAFAYAPNAIGNIAPSSISIVSASGGRLEAVTDAASLNTSPV
jgi:hypothetical protein